MRGKRKVGKGRDLSDFKVIHGEILGGMKDYLESVYQLVNTNGCLI